MPKGFVPSHTPISIPSIETKPNEPPSSIFKNTPNDRVFHRSASKAALAAKHNIIECFSRFHQAEGLQAAQMATGLNLGPRSQSKSRGQSSF
jgi:hypothetical protein